MSETNLFWHNHASKNVCVKFHWKKTMKTIGQKNIEIHKKFTKTIKYKWNRNILCNFCQEMCKCVEMSLLLFILLNIMKYIKMWIKLS